MSTDLKFVELPLTSIQVLEQPRKYFDRKALEELTGSIQKHGILQPISVSKNGDNNYVLVAGERRYKAASKLNLETIPCYIVSGDRDELAIIENLQREDLTIIEEADAVASLIRIRECTQQEMAESLGKSVTTISELVTISEKLFAGVKNKVKKDKTIRKFVLLQVAKELTEKKQLFRLNKLQYLTREEVRKGKTHDEELPVFFKNTDGFAKRLTSLNFNELDTQQRTNLITKLQSLKQSIEEKITLIESSSITAGRSDEANPDQSEWATLS
jgi:ParB family transcriptional regulator, chromosome partitioning protein